MMCEVVHTATSFAPHCYRLMRRRRLRLPAEERPPQRKRCPNPATYRCKSRVSLSSDKLPSSKSAKSHNTDTPKVRSITPPGGWEGAKLRHVTSNRLVAMTKKTSEAIIQCCRSLWHRLVTKQGEIEQYPDRHQLTLSPEMRMELERRCEGQYGD